jgi:hypothetical protein
VPGREREFISRLEGQRCSKFLVQQYWLDGQLEGEWNVLFFGLSDETYVRFLFDSGEFFWREEAPSPPESFDGHDYRLAEPDFSGRLIGHSIDSVLFSSLASGGRTVTFGFANGGSLHVHHHDDQSVVFFSDATAT